MKVRTSILTLAMLFVGLTVCFAANPSLGTWKLNEAKSKLSPGLPKNLTVVYTAAGDVIKGTIDGVDGEGKPTHNEWTGKFDGKDYPVTGDATSDMRAIKQIDDHHFDLTVKKGGKVTMTGKAVVSADGKSRTVTVSGTNAAGKTVTITSVYDKQ
ncbi:MAG: hypothetical protein ACYDDS_16780 [Candidatus Sulfotelmatobacter sp.]|jgi:hypothetical protein